MQLDTLLTFAHALFLFSEGDGDRAIIGSDAFFRSPFLSEFTGAEARARPL